MIERGPCIVPAGILTALLVAGTAGSCTLPLLPPDAAPNDGALDASAHPDAGRDAAPDAAGPERDGGPDDPGWMRVEDLQPHCWLEVARNPEAAVAPLELEPCPEYGASCRRVRIDWEAPPTMSRFWLTGRGDFHEGQGYFVYRRYVTENLVLYVVAREDGRILAVFRSRKASTSTCFVTSVGVGDGSVAVAMYPLMAGSEFRQPRIVGADLADVPGTVRLIREFEEGEVPSTSIDSILPGDELIGLDVGTSWRLRWNGEGDQLAADGGEGETNVGAVVGGAIFYSTGPSSTVPFHVRVAVVDGPAEPFLPLFSESGFESLWLSTDGTDMAWLQLYGPRPGLYWDRVELWAAPYTSDPAALESRQIDGDLPFDNASAYVRVGGGHAVVIREALNLYRLADGAQIARLEPPERRGWGDGIQYMGPEHMAIATNRIEPFDHTALYFVRYDEL